MTASMVTNDFRNSISKNKQDTQAVVSKLTKYHGLVIVIVKKVLAAMTPNLINKLGTKLIFTMNNYKFSCETDVKSNIEGKKLSQEQLDGGTSVYVPKKTFEPFKNSIKSISPINVQLIEWMNSIYHLNTSNNYKTNSNTKTIFIYESNCSLISSDSLLTNFEFSLKPALTSKVE